MQSSLPFGGDLSGGEGSLSGVASSLWENATTRHRQGRWLAESLAGRQRRGSPALQDQTCGGWSPWLRTCSPGNP